MPPPPPPKSWVWAREGDKIEVEIIGARGARWVPAVVKTVHVDSLFSAEIITYNDRWVDWFTWEDEGKDWRRPSTAAWLAAEGIAAAGLTATAPPPPPPLGGKKAAASPGAGKKSVILKLDGRAKLSKVAGSSSGSSSGVAPLGSMVPECQLPLGAQRKPPAKSHKKRPREDPAAAAAAAAEAAAAAAAAAARAREMDSFWAGASARLPPKAAYRPEDVPSPAYGLARSVLVAPPDRVEWFLALGELMALVGSRSRLT